MLGILFPGSIAGIVFDLYKLHVPISHGVLLAALAAFSGLGLWMCGRFLPSDSDRPCDGDQLLFDF